MAQHRETHPARSRAPAKRPAVPGKGRRQAARKLAQGTLMAAGLLAAQFSIPEIDARYHVFDRSLVDKLHAPITRYHE
jgi:hypothetical protein